MYLSVVDIAVPIIMSAETLRGFTSSVVELEQSLPLLLRYVWITDTGFPKIHDG